MPERSGSSHRTTSETDVRVDLRLDGGDAAIDTGIPFFDHMLEQVSRHGRFGLHIHASGDLEVDAHHTVEDVGIAVGEALDQALADRRGIERYGHAIVPMEEALARIALDVSGRPLLVYEAAVPAETIGQYDVALTEEFLQALCRTAGITMHVHLLGGRNAHHCVESIFKALARALRAAVDVDPIAPAEVPSTKGRID